MTEFPLAYAYTREWCIESARFTRYSALVENWAFSAGQVTRIREALAAGLPGEVRTIAAAGSLGRMEACSYSDGDLIIILQDGVSREDAQRAYDRVWGVLDKLNLPRPKPGGVFASPTTLDQLVGSSLGRADEQLSVVGKRLLVLLESQPVFNDDEYEKVLGGILDRFAKGYVRADPSKEWAFLINDLIRYFRALCVNYQYDFEANPGKWPIRNIKLRHSRLVMYAGLLFLLGEASKERNDKHRWLKERLCLTPLERIAYVYDNNADWSFHRIAGLYDVFLTRLNQEEVRGTLVEGEAKKYDDRFKERLYADLKANSDGLVAELLRFVWSRRGVWSERFFEYLIF